MVLDYAQIIKTASGRQPPGAVRACRQGDVCLFVVTDGYGSAQAAELAADTAVQTFLYAPAFHAGTIIRLFNTAHHALVQHNDAIRYEQREDAENPPQEPAKTIHMRDMDLRAQGGLQKGDAGYVQTQLWGGDGPLSAAISIWLSDGQTAIWGSVGDICTYVISGKTITACEGNDAELGMCELMSFEINQSELSDWDIYLLTTREFRHVPKEEAYKLCRREDFAQEISKNLLAHGESILMDYQGVIILCRCEGAG
ncbi:MAG: hypothetical protein ACOYJC_08025 [Christensenellales bacterium]|jgi:hypothetical protein